VQEAAPGVGSWAVHDLRAVVELGQERLAGLLTPPEELICARLLRLQGPPAALFARLSTRRRTAAFVDDIELHGVPDAHAAADALVAAGLLAEGATWAQRLELATVPVLQDWCRARELPVGGRRAKLVARLHPQPAVPASRRLVSRPHVALIQRLERAALLDKRADRGRLVAERLGHVRFPDYPPTGGPVLFRDRAHLLRWEAAWRLLRTQALPPGAAVLALQRGDGDVPGRLSLRHRLSAVVIEHAQELRRRDAPAHAAAWLDALRIARQDPPGALALLRARCLEDQGQLDAALDVLAAGLDDHQGAARLALHRTGRRLARARHRAWVPDPPLASPRRRRLALPAGPVRHRPTWRVGERDLLVEPAVSAVLHAAGRRVVRAEGGLLRALFVHLFHEALLAPVPGQLPVPRLPGPLDLGQPGFAARRPAWVFAGLDAIAAGQAPERIRAAVELHEGVRLGGVLVEPESAEVLVQTALALGPDGLRVLLGPLLAQGFRQTRGLPDLLLLDGPQVRLDGAHPRRVPAGGRWIEVKGPGDTLSDEQRVWLDRFARAGVPAEVWDVVEAPG